MADAVGIDKASVNGELDSCCKMDSCPKRDGLAVDYNDTRCMA